MKQAMTAPVDFAWMWAFSRLVRATSCNILLSTAVMRSPILLLLSSITALSEAPVIVGLGRVSTHYER